MHRQLGPFELAQVLTDEQAPLNAVVAVRLEPGIDAAKLTPALERLQRRHPLLGVRIVRSGNAVAFDSRNVPAIPLRRLRRAGDEHWRSVVEEELDRRFELGRGPLLRLAYLEERRGPGPAELVLSFQHAIMDATSGARLVDELLSDATGGGAAGATRPPMPSVEERFPPAFRGLRRWPRLAAFLVRQLADEARYRWRTRRERRPPPVSEARNRVHSYELSSDATRALVRRSRRERVSIASVLSSAVLLAVARRLYAGRPRAYRAVIFPDLRPYLRPPLEPGDLSSGFVLLRLTTRIDPSSDLWTVSRTFNDQTLRAMRRGDKYAATWVAPWLIRAAAGHRAQRMAHTALSYSGRFDIAPSYGGSRVTGVHAYVSNIPAGPEYTALVRLTDGRLRFDATWLDADLGRDSARQVADDVLLWLSGEPERR